MPDLSQQPQQSHACPRKHHLALVLAVSHHNAAWLLLQMLDGINTIVALMSNAVQLVGMFCLLAESFRLQSMRKLLRTSSGKLASAFSSTFSSFSRLPHMISAGGLLCHS
jgi:hypothetical protein